MGKIKVIKKEVEDKLIDNVIDFATKEGLTVTNITEAMEKVYDHFKGNAVLEKTTEI